MTFWGYLKTDKLIRESLILILLIWVLFATLIGIAAGNYTDLYYESNQVNVVNIIQPDMELYHDTIFATKRFFESSEEVTLEEFQQFCDGVCTVHDNIHYLAYAPQGYVQYVYPSSYENTLIGEDAIQAFNQEELNDFQQHISQNEVFFHWREQAGYATYYSPVYDDDSFVGLIILEVDIASYLDTIVLPVDNDNIILIMENETVSADKDYDRSDYLFTTFSFDGVEYQVGVTLYTALYNRIIQIVVLVNTIIIVSLIIMFSLIYSNQKRNIDFMEQMDYTKHHNLETGLKNHISLYEDFKEIQSLEQSCFIAYGLFSNVKFIHYKYGRDVGNIVINQALDLIKGVLREGSTIYHFGGDEYIILFVSDQQNEVQNIVRRILRLFERDIVIKNIRTNISLSLGLVKFPEHGGTLEELIQNANMTLAQQHNSNKNTFVFYSPKKMNDVMSLHDFDQMVAKMDLSSIDVDLMPIVDVQTETIVGYECLSRVTDAFEEPVDTSAFINSLERNGRIQELDTIIFGRVLSYLIRFNKTFPDSDIFLSCNASALSLNNEFVDNIIRRYKDSHITQGTIVLELTESYKVEDFEYLIRLFTKLNNAGIKTAIDDFGSGYSSLSYITRFPIYSIKLDKMYVQNYHENTFNRTLFFTLKSIAEVLDCRLVAEGVDDPDTLDFLRHNGCEWYQGFLFSKSLPYDKAIQMYQKQNQKE